VTLRARAGLSFLLGFSFSLLPFAAPFVGLMFLISTRLRLRRSDAVWALAAGVTALTIGVHDGLRGALFGLAQVGLPWLVFRSFGQLGRFRARAVHPQLLGLGLVAGLSLVTGLGWLQIDALEFDTAKTISQAIVWDTHPALFGHAVLTLGLLIAIVTSSTPLRLTSLGLAAVGILVSGSREAAIAGVLALLLLLLFGGYRTLRTRLIEGALMVLMVLIAAGLSPLLGWGRVGFLVEASGNSAASNLFLGTEIANGDWWDTSWVTVESTRQVVGGETLTVYTTTKRGEEGWLRLQQLIELQPGATYTLSAWIDSAAPHPPGLQGWGRFEGAEGVETFFAGGTLRDDGWRPAVRGDGELIAGGVAASDGPWQRVYVTFRYGADAPPLTWYVGMAPDTRKVADSTTRFAGFQLEEGALGPYLPGPATEGLAFGVARIPFWRAALDGIATAPLFGRGPDSFPDFFEASRPDRSQLHLTPAHPHNLALEVLFERGLFGLLGLLALLLGLTWAALRMRDAALLAVVGAVVTANLFDSSLFTAGVLYPLAAVAGWRSAGLRSRSGSSGERGRQVLVRTSLAATDLIMALLALAAALPLQRLLADAIGTRPLESAPALLGYALLLWPLLAWREGLYPGYGLTPPQELRKQVVASATAGLLLAAMALLLGQVQLPRTLLLLVIVVATVLLPIGRGLLKRLLNALGVWGRPVVVLGAGETGQRVVEGLRRTPLGGLTPIALFDDDPHLHRRRIGGLRVIGSLADADAFAERHGIDHAIAAIPSLAGEELGQLLDVRGRRFRVIQFVPKLSGIPAEDVFTSNLDGMLALEVRKGLYLRRNRLVKRALDLLLGLTGTVLISPLLLAIYLWIRFDSRGPGFYWSERIGEDGIPFRCLKFRTMHVDADERLGEMIAKSTGIREEYRRFHKLTDDPRITRSGRLLRKFSLDELGQLYNVLQGDMSLVGPRPYLVRERSDMEGRGEVIFQAKPGMTGYWQVAGRNLRTFAERLDMETHYVRNWSIWWDIIILLETVPAVLRRRGAH
jgi:Undecaprenyl-phosphate galactose phosphotransferase WbaP